MITDEQIEAAARALWDCERQGTTWDPWEELRGDAIEGSGVKGNPYYRHLARAALAAVQPEPELDALLDSVHRYADFRVHYGGGEWNVYLWCGGYNDDRYHGTGPTRTAAIKDAIATALAAKEAGRADEAMEHYEQDWSER